MTRTEKVRGLLEQLQEALDGSAFAPLNEITDKTISLLDGCVIVPREATEGMVKAGTERALNTSISSQTGGWPAYINGQWHAMIAAFEEGE